MDGLMMNTQLTVTMILERARRLFPRKQIVSRLPTGMHRYNYAELYERVCQLAGALTEMGIKPGDRVATFAWNSYRHLELYFAIPMIGAVLHTVNIRLAADQLAYIINHAEDQALFFDPTMVAAVKGFLPELKTVRKLIVLCDKPLNDQPFEALVYEDLIATQPKSFQFPELDENRAAGLCYTSGTTGHPKGVLYSHRSTFLHSMASTMSDNLGVAERDTVMPVVPMFHANAWGLPYAAAMVGAQQVFPGPFLQPRDIATLLQNERVTITAGVPTIWLGLMGLLEQEQFDLSQIRAMLIGGSAVPASMISYFDKKFNIPVLQAWGMTETSPLGSVGKLKSSLAALPAEERLNYQTKQGVPAACVEIRALNDDGEEIPWDGTTRGELQVRGPWVARAYYNTTERAEAFQQGWFSTGDVVTIDPEGYISIVDRTKDVIKSGGEWISSVDLELALIGHPKIQEAAVVAVAHEKWIERPLACVVPKPDWRDKLETGEVLEYLRERFAPWWIPDAVVFIEEVPKTSVGKFDKKRLREQFKEHKWS